MIPSHASSATAGSGSTSTSAGHVASASPIRIPGRTPAASAAAVTGPSSGSVPSTGASAAGRRASPGRASSAARSSNPGMARQAIISEHMFYTNTRSPVKTSLHGSPRRRRFGPLNRGGGLDATARTARVAGVFFAVTFIASIPAVLLYAPVLDHADYVLGDGADTRIAFGAFLEIILAVANIGTAVVLFPVVKRVSESVALGYVASRVLESTVIVVGLISLMSVVTLRQDVGGTDAV